MTSGIYLTRRSAKRVCSSQKNRSLVGSVPKTVASGTRILFSDHREESTICRAAPKKLFGTPLRSTSRGGKLEW
jgi:hypothetical protein